MADEKWLGVLKEGALSWNAHRGDHPGTPSFRTTRPMTLVDLSGADLRGLSLAGVILSLTNLSHANLRGMHLEAVSLDYSDLREANLSEAKLCNANLSGADLRKAILKSGPPPTGEYTPGTHAYAYYLSVLRERRRDLGGANLSDADLSGADLTEAYLGEVDLRGAKLREAVLKKVELKGANLSDADLSGADLTEAYLGKVDLRGAKLREAVLKRVDLTDAHVGSTDFPNVVLSEVGGLPSVVHEGPSKIGMDTIRLSSGRIDKDFLRKAGVPEDYISYAQSLAGPEVRYSSCFVSYSGKDKAFADQLHADLVKWGVHCWFAPNDLRGGETFRESIAGAIPKYDRLLVLLSESSVQSTWVEWEVTAGRERESREDRLVLCPVRIEEVVLSALRPWAADLVSSRHILDFTGWREPASYAKALDHLLRSLAVPV